jgi:two-component system alkaline phosphatase synthesis response regulator PhoP
MIYFLEDDDNIRNFVVYALDNSGISAQGFEKPSDFYGALEHQLPELVLLDIMLPEEDGLEVLKKLRARADTRTMPVIVLSARGTEYDKVIGLDSGADDYVSKPFGIMELVSRIRALLRRTGGGEKSEYMVGGLYVNPEKHMVLANGTEVALTYKEFELLCVLIRDPGTVFTRDALLSQIWGYQFDGENRTVDVHIRTLRAKLGECGELIETVRGIGYKIGEK